MNGIRMGALLLLVAGALGAGGSGRAQEGAALQEIILIRTPGLGVGPQDRLVLRADGTALYSGGRNVPRMGEHRGRLPQGEFERLAGVLWEARFFSMEPEFRMFITGRVPVRDAASVMVTVTRGTERKSVAEYGQAAPPEFRKVVGELQAAADRVRWGEEEPPPAQAPQARQSGIRGVARLGPLQAVQRPGEENSRPYPDAVLSIRRARGGKEVKRARADAEGRFTVALPAGTYRVVPVLRVQHPFPRAEAQRVTVRPHRLTEIVVRYDTGIR